MIRTSNRRWLALSSVTALTAATALIGAPAARADPPGTEQVVTVSIPAVHATIPAQWLGYSGPPKADVLLPPDYDPSKKYPLMLFLNGLNNNYASSVSYIESVLPADYQAIIVIPEGANGWYADWYNNGQYGGPQWETYILQDVLPAIMADYPILPDRHDHAVAGISMGGLGAAYLAGRLPGFFGSVATLSGFVDPQYFAPIAEGGMALTSYLLMGNSGTLGWVLDPYAVEGPPNGFYADGHNPVRLAANLGQTRVFQSTGTGVPSQSGVASLATPQDFAALVEGSAAEGPIIYPMNQLYHQALVAAGDDVTYQVHAGGHDIPDFENEITAMFAWNPFAPVSSDPTEWTNDTVASSGTLWDISYAFAHQPAAVVHFEQSGASLSISAAGSAVTITTSDGCVIHTSTPVTMSLTGC